MILFDRKTSKQKLIILQKCKGLNWGQIKSFIGKFHLFLKVHTVHLITNLGAIQFNKVMEKKKRQRTK